MPIHYSSSEKDGITYCGSPYKIREFPDWKKRPLFADIKERVTCKKCQEKLKKEEELDRKLHEYFLKIDIEIGWNVTDNYLLGYSEAVSNMLGEFNNGRCEDCAFCFETETTDFESCQPEAVLNCSLERCWIEEIKKIIRGT